MELSTSELKELFRLRRGPWQSKMGKKSPESRATW